ncbi:UbiX family flavin prenyltransferase [Mycobacterium sp. NPDC006124]|uniref:UbiX family flavin prenyltransferase n=1 Tax=Mycobacterium sp. NPDC006124 TaxID=3156729 RepID=UPI0033A18BCB
MRRVIVAITGASGAIYGIRALELLGKVEDVETHLIVTPSGRRTIAQETDYGLDEVRSLADRHHDPRDIGAPVSSGSFVTTGMLVAPCSVKTLSGIANSYNDELAVRAADVCLKERRRVVLLLRETPLHAGHIDLMARATANGAIIMPPVPAFYALPRSLDDVVDQTVSRALELLDVVIPGIKRWDGRSAAPDET